MPDTPLAPSHSQCGWGPPLPSSCPRRNHYNSTRAHPPPASTALPTLDSGASVIEGKAHGHDSSDRGYPLPHSDAIRALHNLERAATISAVLTLFSCPMPERQSLVVNLDGARRYRCLALPTQHYSPRSGRKKVTHGSRSCERIHIGEWSRCGEWPVALGPLRLANWATT